MPDLKEDLTPRCVGTVKSTGNQCRLNAIEGGTVCKKHGGSARQVAAAAARRAQQAKAKVLVATYGLPVETTAEDALFDELYRSKGHVKWLEEQVQELSPQSLIWGETTVVVAAKEATEFPGVDRTATESAQVHMWLELYQRERKHYFDVAAKIAALNLEERRVRIDEGKATVLIDVIRRVLAERGLSLKDAEVAGSVRRHLQLVTGSAS